MLIFVAQYPVVDKLKSIMINLELTADNLEEYLNTNYFQFNSKYIAEFSVGTEKAILGFTTLRQDCLSFLMRLQR